MDIFKVSENLDRLPKYFLFPTLQNLCDQSYNYNYLNFYVISLLLLSNIDKEFNFLLHSYNFIIGTFIYILKKTKHPSRP